MKTRSGLNAEIITRVNDKNYPVVVKVTFPDGTERVHSATENLEFIGPETYSPYDIAKPEVELNKTYKDGEGTNIKIICLDADLSDMPVLGLINRNTKNDGIRWYTLTGQYEIGRPSPRDLIL